MFESEGCGSTGIFSWCKLNFPPQYDITFQVVLPVFPREDPAYRTCSFSAAAKKITHRNLENWSFVLNSLNLNKEITHLYPTR